MKIQKLSDQVINQIAAGEVVDRPKSIVKELLENSIDAHATNIRVCLEQGGIDKIEIVDDGVGIEKDQLALALDRHATSKINSLDDLHSIASLGFRGEALASIASVSRLKLSSLSQNATQGWAISLEQGITPQSCNIGTTVIVKDLFYNVPARRKFLRRPSTEFKHAEEVFKQIALSHLSIDFQLKHNGDIVYSLPACENEAQKTSRISILCGSEFAKHSMYISNSRGEIHVHGWIAQPAFSRSRADMQYVFVNGRWVKDNAIAYALKNAYRDVLHGARYPAYVLYIQFPSELIDFNVHPAKHEVRFKDTRDIYQFLVASITNAIEQIQDDTYKTIHNSADFFAKHIQTPSLQNTAYAAQQKDTTQQAALHSQAPLYQPASNTRQYQNAIRFYQPETTPAPPREKHIHSEVPEKQLQQDIPPLGYALGQIHNIYIVAQNQQGLVLVDMHAAHERVLYEQLKEHYTSIQVQYILEPIEIHLSQSDMAIANEQIDYFKKFGFEIEQISDTSIWVRSIPHLLQKQDCRDLIQNIIGDIKTHNRSEAISQRINATLGNIACKAAIKANKQLHISEMNALLRDMENTPNSGQCNHGRPTWVQLPITAMDALFMRGQ